MLSLTRQSQLLLTAFLATLLTISITAISFDSQIPLDLEQSQSSTANQINPKSQTDRHQRKAVETEPTQDRGNQPGDTKLAQTPKSLEPKLYFFDSEYEKILDETKQVVLLKQLEESDKSKPASGIYYISYVSQQEEDILVSVATKTLQEESLEPSENIEDSFFTVKIGTPITKTGSNDTGLLSVNDPYANYKLPWRTGEAWRTENGGGGAGQYDGWHYDATGPSLDFIPPSDSSMDIISAGPGQVNWQCKDAYGQAGVHIQTIESGKDYGEILRYYHLDSSEVYVNTWQFVEQGKLLGKLSNQATNPTSPSCNLPSSSVHLHFGLPYTPITFDGYTFVEDGELYADQDLISSQSQIVGNLLIESPPSNAKLKASFRYPLGIDHFSDEHLLTKIELFENDTKIREITNEPFDVIWYAQNPGNRTLKVVTHYTGGSQSEDSVNVRVDFGYSDWKTDQDSLGQTPPDLITIGEGKFLQTKVSPGGAVYTRLSNTNNILNYVVDWTSWQNAGNPNTSENVATIFFNQKIYQYLVADDQTIYVRSSDDALTWSGWSDIGQAHSAIEVVEFKGKIYQIYLDENDRVQFRTSSDGESWNPEFDGLIDSLYAPSITSDGPTLYQTAVGLDQHIYTRSSKDGTTWTDWTNVPNIGEYSYRPANIQAVGNTLFQAHQGTNGKIYLRASYDQGATWTDWSTDNSLSAGEPELFEINHELYQTRIDTDGYISWRKLDYYQIADADLI